MGGDFLSYLDPRKWSFDGVAVLFYFLFECLVAERLEGR